ncbi:MAG: hypothetical protein ACE5I5_12175 [Candidatus Heimdallarchaeota archaeon]
MSSTATKKATSTYTFEETGAIATITAAALWGLAALGVTIAFDLISSAEVIFFSVLDAIFWTLALLYLLRIEWSYLVGIAAQAIGIVAMFIPSEGWTVYDFAYPVLDFSAIVVVVIFVAGIYFSYIAYKNLRS